MLRMHARVVDSQQPVFMLPVFMLLSRAERSVAGAPSGGQGQKQLCDVLWSKCPHHLRCLCQHR